MDTSTKFRGGGQSLPLTFFEGIMHFSKKKFKAMFFQKGIKKLFYRGISVKCLAAI
jgi:hypothetical protein